MARTLEIVLPDWLDDRLPADAQVDGDHAKMRLVLELARENVRRRTGGPFAAAVFERESGRLIGAGVNIVVPAGSSVLHAEIVAFLAAQRALGRYTLGATDLPEHELVTSCEPCAMCLGATLWSGVRRVLAGAVRDDALALQFDEGPVFAASYAYLEARGIQFVSGVLREEAREVLAAYREAGGEVYNG
ncbi:MAG: nucleoside deaminase [Longimicrobiales bacterium]